MAKSKEESREFKERTQLIKLQRVADKERHALKMEELVYMRDSENIKHEQDMTRQRIKSAEIRKTQERREFSEMGRRTQR